MECPAGHPELSGQFRKPPLLLRGTSRAKVACTPAANGTQPETLEHFGDGLPALSASYEAPSRRLRQMLSSSSRSFWRYCEASSESSTAAGSRAFKTHPPTNSSTGAP